MDLILRPRLLMREIISGTPEKCNLKNVTYLGEPNLIATWQFVPEVNLLQVVREVTEEHTFMRGRLTLIVAVS